jgi:hypothetical protein
MLTVEDFYTGVLCPHVSAVIPEIGEEPISKERMACYAVWDLRTDMNRIIDLSPYMVQMNPECTIRRSVEYLPYGKHYGENCYNVIKEEYRQLLDLCEPESYFDLMEKLKIPETVKPGDLKFWFSITPSFDCSMDTINNYRL